MLHLNETELEVLSILWEHGPLKPGEIEEKLSQDINNATLRSLLRKLELEHKVISRKRSGKAYLYRARVKKERALSDMLKRITSIFAGGSSVSLIAELVDRDALSAEELAELRRMASKKTSKDKRS